MILASPQRRNRCADAPLKRGVPARAGRPNRLQLAPFTGILSPIFGEPSTGASNDLERVTELARRMVTEFGMTEALGPVRYAPNAGFGYLPTQTGLRQEISPETAKLVDEETRRLVEEAQERAMDLLRVHEAALHEVAQVLQEREVISGHEIARIAEEHST
jgi:cell division protease FtsH